MLLYESLDKLFYDKNLQFDIFSQPPINVMDLILLIEKKKNVER